MAIKVFNESGKVSLNNNGSNTVSVSEFPGGLSAAKVGQREIPKLKTATPEKEEMTLKDVIDQTGAEDEDFTSIRDTLKGGGKGSGECRCWLVFCQCRCN